MTITPKSESASQEAMETAPQTRAEAAKGDLQASAKLARQSATKAPSKPPVSEKGLDAKA